MPREYQVDLFCRQTLDYFRGGTVTRPVTMMERLASVQLLEHLALCLEAVRSGRDVYSEGGRQVRFGVRHV